MTERVHIITGRPAETDLAQINAVVEAAVQGWALSERIKRLVLPSYRYGAIDLRHLGFACARHRTDGRIVGVAAWEPADRRDCPPGQTGLLLHGLYVVPEHQRRGIGHRLLGHALAAAAAGFDGLLVKAQRDAEPFFVTEGFQRLPVTDDGRDYAGRFWRPTADRPGARG